MTDLNLSVRWLDSPSDAEIKRIQAIYEVAFENDIDFMKHVFGGERSLVSVKFYSNILSAKIGGKIQVASVGPDVEDIVGAALWFGPGQDHNATEEQRKGGGSLLMEAGPPHVRKWWIETLVPTMEALYDTNLGPGFRKDQWCLFLFGVVPEYHRRGIGKTMVKVVEQIACEDNMSIVLETHTPLDVMIYGRMGYQLKGEVAITSYDSEEFMMYLLMKTPQ